MKLRVTHQNDRNLPELWSINGQIYVKIGQVKGKKRRILKIEGSQRNTCKV